MAPKRPSTAAAAVTPLPPYEPPLLPLTPAALTALTALTENHGRPTPIDKLTRSVSGALDKLGEIAADLAEHVPTGAAGPDDPDAAHRPARQRLLDDLEAQARLLVDQGKVADDIKEVLGLAARDAREAAAAAAAAAAGDGAEAEAEDERGGVVGGFRRRMVERADHYEGLGMRSKYGNVAEYVQFRRLVWTSQHGDTQMPKASAWFDHLDPAHPAHPAQPRDDGDDSDIEIARERHSYQCPLTLRTFVEPYTSTVCPHSFERAAILEYVRGRGRACPVPGCVKVLTAATVKPDPVLERRVKRARRMEEEQQDQEEEEEEEEEEVKREGRKGGRGRGRGRVVEVSDEE